MFVLHRVKNSAGVCPPPLHTFSELDTCFLSLCVVCFVQFPLSSKNECSPQWYELQREEGNDPAGEIEATIFQVVTEVKRPVKVQQTAEGLLRNWMMKTFDADADTLAEVAAVLDDMVSQIEMEQYYLEQELEEEASNGAFQNGQHLHLTRKLPRPDQRGRTASSPLLTLQATLNKFRLVS